MDKDNPITLSEQRRLEQQKLTQTSGTKQELRQKMG
jgi:hypothetical protein